MACAREGEVLCSRRCTWSGKQGESLQTGWPRPVIPVGAGHSRSAASLLALVSLLRPRLIASKGATGGKARPRRHGSSARRGHAPFALPRRRHRFVRLGRTSSPLPVTFISDLRCPDAGAASRAGHRHIFRRACARAQPLHRLAYVPLLLLHGVRSSRAHLVASAKHGAVMQSYARAAREAGLTDLSNATQLVPRVLELLP